LQEFKLYAKQILNSFLNNFAIDFDYSM